jgi:peptide/nickel transport system permease protein
MYAGRISLTFALSLATLGLIVTAIVGGAGTLLGKWWDYIADPFVSLRNALPDLPVAVLLVKLFPLGFVTMWVLLLFLSRTGGVRFAPPGIGRIRPPSNESTTVQVDGPGRTSQNLVLLGVSGLLVAAAAHAAWAVLMETSLSWLGLGIQPPTPSWGNMLSNAQQYFFSAPWLVFYPGVLILLSVLGLNLVAEGPRRVSRQGETRG